MKTYLTGLSAFLFCILFSGCQKDLSVVNEAAKGKMSKDASGDCSPIITGGAFHANTTLTENNYLDVQINFTTAGSYQIKTDTINGYSFRGAGAATSGLQTIRLTGSGKPLVQSVDIFLIRFDSSVCEANVIVTDPGSGPATTAVFTLGSTQGACTGAVTTGTYTVGIPLNASNTLTLQANVTTAGSYTVTTNTVNGISFSNTAIFTSAGAQTILLSGSGTPLVAGTNNFNIQNANSTCSFSVTVTPSSAPNAVFTLGGSPGACTGTQAMGTYTAGAPLNVSHTLSLQVNVTNPGAYTLTTNTVNGISFSRTGIFTSAGLQTVILSGSGTPISAGANNFSINGPNSSCSFSLTVVSGGSNASFTLGGSPGLCTGAVAYGNYATGIALTASNKLSVQVNIATMGSYTISTNTVNGISFSKTGTFTVLGLQTVDLQGVGTPLTTGTNSYNVTGGGNTCSAVITVYATIAPGIFTCKLNGVFNNFANPATLVFTNITNLNFKIFGTLGTNFFDIWIQKSNFTLVPGSYNVDMGNGLYVKGQYTVYPGANYWLADTNGSVHTNPFTVFITSITPSRVTGTFSGKIIEMAGTGPLFKTVTEGVFDMPR